MIKVARLTFITEKRFRKRDAEKLRGYFGTLYREEDLFHNHMDENRVIYRMPFIQYKVIDGMLNVFGYECAVPVLTDKFLKVKQLTINGRTIDHFETQITVKREEFGISDELYSYRFESLWLPVTQKNYLAYINNIEWFAFSGEFVTNVDMPDYMSVGRNRSIGFGSVVRKRE